MDGLLRELAPDAVYYGDGGGKARALAAAMHGRERIAASSPGCSGRCSGGKPGSGS